MSISAAILHPSRIVTRCAGRCRCMAVAAIWSLSLLCLSHAVQGKERESSAIRDIPAAREYCDNAPLAPVEGIWDYPEDGVTVLVKRVPASQGRFEIIALESDDTRITPGDVVGEIAASPDPLQYRMSLNTRSRANLLSDPAECLATLSKDGNAIYVKMKKRSITLNATWILPRFWRVARIKTKNPLDNLPAGMVKVYPSYDGNGSDLHEPRYL